MSTYFRLQGTSRIIFNGNFRAVFKFEYCPWLQNMNWGFCGSTNKSAARRQSGFRGRQVWSSPSSSVITKGVLNVKNGPTSRFVRTWIEVSLGGRICISIQPRSSPHYVCMPMSIVSCPDVRLIACVRCFPLHIQSLYMALQKWPLNHY